MLGRTLATVLLLLVTQLASGCCGCYRPFFCCKQRFCGGCCEPCGAAPCMTCYGGPTAAPVPVAPPTYPVANVVPVQPAVTVPTTPVTTPANNPPLERIPSFSSATLLNGGHR
jgi:hypothetical protein